MPTQTCAEQRGARIKRAATIACVKRVTSTITKPKAALVSACLSTVANAVFRGAEEGLGSASTALNCSWGLGNQGGKAEAEGDIQSFALKVVSVVESSSLRG